MRFGRSRGRRLISRRVAALGLGGATTLAACSLFVPFSQYDKAEPDASSPPGDAGASCDAALANDTHHCGACDHDCRGTPCTDGLCAPQLLVQDDRARVTAIALDDQFVYGAASTTGGDNGIVFKFQKDFSTVFKVTTLATGIWGSASLAVVGDSLYWTQGTYVDAGAGSPEKGIGRVSTSGEGKQLLVSGQVNPFWIIADGTRLVWVNTPGGGDVWTSNGSAPADARRIAPSMRAEQVVADDTFLYWTVELPEGSVVRANKDGTGLETLAANQFNPVGLTTDGEFLYWVTKTPGAVRRMPKTGGAYSDIAVDQPTEFPYFVVVDDRSVYWMTDTAILRAPKEGGPSFRLAAVTENAWNMAVDGVHLYWINENKIYRVPK